MKLHFLDIGARKGRTAALLLKNPNPNIRVYLFEPNPYLMSHLKNRFKDDSRISFYQQAFTDRNNFQTFYIPEDTSESSSLYADKKTSVGSPTIQVECIDAIPFIRNLSPGPVVLYSNCEGSEFDFIPALINSGVYERIKLWSIAFHHGDRKIPSMKPVYQEIEKNMERLEIENVVGHYGKGDIKAGKLDEFVEGVLKLLP